MISINYNRLFNLQLRHTFYADKKARGVRIEPVRATRQHLQNGNMLFKKLPAGIVVLYRAQQDEVTPVVELPDDLRMTFSISVENQPEFLTITNLNQTSPAQEYQSSNILYFSNDPASASSDSSSPEELTHQLLDAVKNSLFTYSFSVAGNPDEVLLKVLDVDGQPISAGTTVEGDPLPTSLPLTPQEDDSFSQQIDLRDQSPGVYTIRIRNKDDNSTLGEQVFYVDDELARRQVLGVLDLIYTESTGHLYGATEEYWLTFNRQESIWTYFIVNANNNITLPGDDLEIDDLPTVDYSPVGFTQQGAEPNADVVINGKDTVIFKSNAPIPFYEVPKASIQLKKNPGNQVLVNNLPNASPNGTIKNNGGTLESEIYVFI